VAGPSFLRVIQPEVRVHPATRQFPASSFSCPSPTALIEISPCYLRPMLDIIKEWLADMGFEIEPNG